MLAALLTFQITYLALDGKYDRKLSELEVEMSEFAKLFEIKEYADSQYINEYEEKDLIDELASAYLKGIGDKYGRYYAADEIDIADEIYFGKIVGIGVTIIHNQEENAIEVTRVYKDSPAENAQIKIGDLIVAVDGSNVSDVGYEAAIDMVKGEVGTSVKITLIRDGNTIECDVIRAEISNETVTYSMLSDGITGFVRVSNFIKSTAEDFKSAVESLKESGASRFIFDMRYNTGGELSSVVNTLDYLLPEGPIVRILDKNGEVETKQSDSNFIDAPMVVLVNGRTASAAELFTIGLLDYKKAVVVGTQTYGKGTIQTLYTLSDGSVFTLSNGLFCGPYSENFEGVGITPDITVELSEEAQNEYFERLTEENDNQLREALKVFDNYGSYFAE